MTAMVRAPNQGQIKYRQKRMKIMQDYLEDLLDENFEEFEDDFWSEDYSDV